MKCIYCEHPESKVIDSRPTDEGTVIRRRRECLACAKRFTTYEKVERTPVLVVKKDGRREYFDVEKIRTGIVRSCEKRPISIEQIDELVEEIEKSVYNTLEREITSDAVGELVMAGLKKLDGVAYVRFASVYREFKDVDTFLEELNSVIRNNTKSQKKK